MIKLKQTEGGGRWWGGEFKKMFLPPTSLSVLPKVMFVDFLGSVKIIIKTVKYEIF